MGKITTKIKQNNTILRWILFIFSLIQIYRIFGVGFTLYVSYDAIIVKKEQTTLFDGAGDFSTGSHTNPDMSQPAALMDDVPIPQREVDTMLLIQLTIPVTEVLVSAFALCLIFGPLSVKVTYKMWIIWLLKLRIFWMRLLWTATAVAYATMLPKFYREMYKFGQDPQYLYNDVNLVTLGATALEYFHLGILEVTMKIMTTDKIISRVCKVKKRLNRFWNGVLVFNYYSFLLVYVLRNFTMSLYFGILTSFATHDAIENAMKENKSIYGGFIVVLQIYLALIRGRLYGFFMHSFLSNFFVEEGDEMFNINKEKCDDVQDNGDVNEVSANGSREELNTNRFETADDQVHYRNVRLECQV